MSILLTAFHTLNIFYLSLTDFQNFPGPVAFFQDFPVLENATIKFQDFPGFPGPVRTLSYLRDPGLNIKACKPGEEKKVASFQGHEHHQYLLL